MISAGAINHGIKKGDFMENNNVNINAIIGRQRKVLMQYGPYFGQQLFTIRVTNPDLTYKEDILNGKNTLRNPVNVYVIEPVDIQSIKFIERDVDGNPKIIFNSDVKGVKPLIFPIEPPKFCKATRESLAECIDQLGKPNAKPMFFSAQDLSELVDLVAAANQTALDFFNEISRKFLQLSETVSGMMDANMRMKNDYYSQCGLVEEQYEVSASVNVE